MTDTAWESFARELDAWREGGRTATFWWRDDDAIDATPSLMRLLGISRAFSVPLMLAVIPAKATPALGTTLTRLNGVVLQHGFAHINHAPAGAPKSELSGVRPLAERLAELASGCHTLADLVGPRLLPVLVPPWNRIDDDLVDALAASGYTALSTFRPRARPFARPGLAQVNTHLDLIDWAGTRHFVGTAHALAVLVGHLAARRAAWGNSAQTDEATGVLSHHLAMDEPSWDFLETLLRRTEAHPAVRWLDAAELFPEPFPKPFP
jgi:hypothetical protein